MDPLSSIDIISNSKKRRRRTFEAISLDEVPYPKKPRMMDNLRLSVHETEKLNPANLPLIYDAIDTIWMVSHALRLPNVPMWSNLLVSGSVNGFLEGKHFNRCKRLHPLMELGLQVLHFKSFLEFKNTTVTDQKLEEITRLQTSPISSFKIENEELEELLNEYNIFK
ncbi:hypothetical protein KGM_215425 [Danaus plexippus plexippus]|uniref:Uncharacterized protein n=1 Tax=Danaus plexippus plexippus TaxID=278856 RepID=A0A212FLG4_DANPL|nr:hypothetical protein KGM_215425 [Danaus plexippus plexippus]